MALKNVFVHHVFFWLKRPDNGEDRDRLVAGLQTLTAIGTIKKSHIGLPADTHRDVIVNSYAVSWLVFFENPADQESYQTDPIHLRFVSECSPLWDKVVVYDSVDI